MRITPSIFVVAQKPEGHKSTGSTASPLNEKEKRSDFDLFESLICPNPMHMVPLSIKGDKLYCPNGESYKLVDGQIPDLRYPIPKEE